MHRRNIQRRLSQFVAEKTSEGARHCIDDVHERQHAETRREPIYGALSPD